jgi:hypothetical protein
MCIRHVEQLAGEIGERNVFCPAASYIEHMNGSGKAMPLGGLPMSREFLA